MAETYFFIQLQNAEPFMMSIDKEVNYQTFDEEVKKRFSKSTEDNLLYTFLSANGESTIQNDEDLSNALTFAESLGDDFLFVINVTEKPKTVEKVERELEELEELEKLVPEEQKDSFSIPISGHKEEPVKEEKKDSERKDDGIDLFEFFKNQITEQLPALSPILGSLNFENLINNINNVNNNDNNEEKDVLEEIPNIIKQFLPVVLGNLQSVPKVSIPCPPPPPPPHYMRFPQAFSCPPPPPPPAPHVRFACSQNPFMQSFACPNIRSMPAFVPPSSQPQNPLHSLFEMLLKSDAAQSQRQQQDKPKSPVCHMAVCDHCSKQIIGIRYKCLNCPNFDLCERCEVYSPQCHNPDHVFAKIRTTNQFIAPRVPVPPQCRRPVNQPLRSVHPQPHFCAKPPVKLNIIRPHPPPTVQFPPQVRPHPVPPYMRSCPKPVPENDKIKTLEEQIASLESSIASIKSSLASQKEEKPRPQPSRRSIFNYSFESDDSDESDGSDDSEGEDQVFEVKVNKRW